MRGSIELRLEQLYTHLRESGPLYILDGEAEADDEDAVDDDDALFAPEARRL
eukprot:m.307395 g.307395  ORF g.307395 m.307395 type:complete len:52 (-) comp19921_c0_seq1:4390-4545(-)